MTVSERSYILPGKDKNNNKKNERGTGHILSKIVLNIKMIHIGKFIAIVELCIIFTGNCQKLLL